MLLFPDQFIIDPVPEFVCQCQDVIQSVRMVQENVRGLRNQIVSAECSPCFPLSRIDIELTVSYETIKDMHECVIKIAANLSDEVESILVGVFAADRPVLYISLMVL